jgi:hypothetical protein
LSIIKYDNSGVLQWSNHFSQPNKSISPAGLCLDGNDQIYIAGTSDSSGQAGIVVVKYNQQGSEDWVFEYPKNFSSFYLSGFAVNPNGNVCVAGSTDYSQATLLKITPNGTQEWLVTYTGPNYSIDAAVDLGIDSLRNIYICGTRNWAGGSYLIGYTILKYDRFGNLLWKQVDDSTNANGSPVMKVAANGTVFQLYSTIGQEGDASYASLHLTSFDASGNLKWSVEYKPPANVWLTPSEILLKQDGNIYTIARRNGPDETSAILLQKFSSAGNLVWSTETENKRTFGKESSKLDIDGNIYIAVRQPNTADTIFVLKYDMMGQQKLFASFGRGDVFYEGELAVLTVDESGFVYVSCNNNNNNNGDFLTIKFDKYGTHQWTATYDGDAHLDDIPIAMCVDKNDNVFVGGRSSDTNVFDTFAIISYNSQGTLRWLSKEYIGWDFNGSTSNGDLTIDNNGNVYVATGEGDFITCKYSNEGLLIWRDQFSNSSSERINEFPVAMALDGQDYLYVTGTNLQSGAWGNTDASIISTLQYDLSTTNVENIFVTQPERFTLSQNYPNPFNPVTKISYAIPQNSFVELKVFNLLGQEVTTLVNKEKPAGNYEVNFNASNLPSGVYIYKMKAGDFIETKKMILLK